MKSLINLVLFTFFIYFISFPHIYFWPHAEKGSWGFFFLSFKSAIWVATLHVHTENERFSPPWPLRPDPQPLTKPWHRARATSNSKRVPFSPCCALFTPRYFGCFDPATAASFAKQQCWCLCHCLPLHPGIKQRRGFRLCPSLARYLMLSWSSFFPPKWLLLARLR